MKVLFYSKKQVVDNLIVFDLSRFIKTSGINDNGMADQSKDFSPREIQGFLFSNARVEYPAELADIIIADLRLQREYGEDVATVNIDEATSYSFSLDGGRKGGTILINRETVVPGYSNISGLMLNIASDTKQTFDISWAGVSKNRIYEKGNDREI